MLRPPMVSPGQRLRELMRSQTVLMPGVFNPISALVAHQSGASALYLTGAGVTNANLGVPDIALITQTEMSDVAAKVSQVVSVPVLADADTGYGESANVFRTVIEMERSGLAGIHLEDQVSPKRCGHLDGKAVIEPTRMTAKLRAAVEAKRDSAFVIVARTDARGVEGLDAALDRARQYVDAGADAVFPEGLESEAEFEAFRRAVSVPLLANMTEFGKTPLLPVSRFEQMGYQMVIFPMTAFRTMLYTLARTYEALIQTGTQAGLLAEMKTRAELYETLHYASYHANDQRWSSPD